MDLFLSVLPVYNVHGLVSGVFTGLLSTCGLLWRTGFKDSFIRMWCTGLFRAEHKLVSIMSTTRTALPWQKQNWTCWRESTPSNVWTSCLTVGRGKQHVWQAGYDRGVEEAAPSNVWTSYLTVGRGEQSLWQEGYDREGEEAAPLNECAAVMSSKREWITGWHGSLIAVGEVMCRNLELNLQ